MKYSILLVLLLIVSLNAPAQMFSGRVLDDQKIPVQYATVALLSVADSSLISGTVTDEQGICRGFDKYALSVGCVVTWI